MSGSSYRLRAGYAFAVDRLGATPPPWRRLPDDAWDTIVLDHEETEHCAYIGTRTIDGTTCAVFVAPEGRAHVYLAQTAVYCAQPTVRLPDGREVAAERCACGDGSCAACDNDGWAPAGGAL